MTTSIALTEVLNSYNDEIVLLPVENELVKALLKPIGVEDYFNGSDLMVIEGREYDELAEVLELPELSGDETRDYFVKLCNKSAGYGTPMLADVGYEHIFGELIDSGFTVQAMIEQMHKIIMSWHQADAEHVLDECDVDYTDIPDEDKVGAAIDAIMENDFMSYETNYDIDGETLLLYSAS